MILKIDAKEKNAFEKCCEVFGLRSKFYTVENNPRLLQLEILAATGSEIDPEEGYLIGRLVGGELMVDKIKDLI